MFIHMYQYWLKGTSECFTLFIVKNNEDWGGNQMSNQNNNTEKIKPQKRVNVRHIYSSHFSEFEKISYPEKRATKHEKWATDKWEKKDYQ